MDSIQLVNEFHQRLNFSTILSFYGGRVYYADLYSSNSYVIEIVFSLMALIGILSNFMLLFIHLGAIMYGRCHLYKLSHLMNSAQKSNYIEDNRNNNSTTDIGHLTAHNAGDDVNDADGDDDDDDDDDNNTVNRESNIDKRKRKYNFCNGQLNSFFLIPFNLIAMKVNCLQRLFCRFIAHLNFSKHNVTKSNEVMSTLFTSTVTQTSTSTKLTVSPFTTTTTAIPTSTTGIMFTDTSSTTFTLNSAPNCNEQFSLSSSSTKLSKSHWPGVSILKPLSGVDLNLETNLSSFFNLNYPTYELLFCVSDIDDPVCNIVSRLITTHLQVDARLVLATEVIGVNPKIQNLQAGYKIAKHDLILISDSSLWMRPDTLTDMVISLESEPHIGLVHQLPYMKPRTNPFQLPSDLNLPFYNDKFYTCCRASKHRFNESKCGIIDSKQPSFAWVVQLIFFSCWHAKMYLVAALLNIDCVTGMSCLLRREVLRDSEGFKQFSCYLAEDFFISKYVHHQGWKIRLSHQPAWQNSPSPRLYQFYLRIVRWSQLRMSMIFVTFLLEPLTRCFPNAILGAISFSYIFPDIIDSGVYFLCYILIWFILDYILMLQIYPPSTPTCITKFEYLVAWVFSELLALPVHFSALFAREVRWRNKRFRLHWGGLSERITEPFHKPKHPHNTDLTV